MFKLKKALLSAAIGFSGFTYAQNCTTTGCNSTPFLTDDFNVPSLWNSVDNDNTTGSFNFAGGRANFTKSDVSTNSNIQGLACARETRIYRKLPVTLSNTSFKAQFDFEIKGGNVPWHHLLSFTAGTQDPYSIPSGCGSYPTNCSSYPLSNQDAINIDLFGTGTCTTYNDRPITAGGWVIRVTTRKGTTDVHSATIPFNQANTRFYASFERVGGSNGVLSIFSDAARTTHITGSPICFTIDPTISGLNTMQIGTLSAGSYARSAEGNVDNIRLYDCNVPALTITASPTDSICPGTPVTLCATPGYVNYTWTPGNQTSSSIIVTPTVTTTYTVTAHYPFSTACTYTATITVKVRSVPTLNANFNRTATYIGTSNNYNVTATPLTSNATINSLGAGYGYAWMVREVDVNGVDIPGTIMINPPNWMNNNPTADFPGYCCNSNSSIAGVFSNQKKYRITRTVWGPCTTPASITYTFDVDPSFGPGQAPIRMTLVGGARVATSSTSSSIIAESNEAFNVFPNPTTQNLINVESGSIKGNKTIRVVNAEGKNVLEKTSNESLTELDLNGLSYGLYLLSITSEDGNVVFSKFIKQ